MIHVQRDQTDEAGKIIEPNSAWFQLAAAKTKRAIKERGKQKADGKVYAHDEVRKALERLFHDKCAYCELTKVEGWEVDHFRPKGRVAEREDHPGYYWLTYVWENLYPSCQHCNQRRKDRPRWADQAGLPAGGKADQFPLLDESSRAMRPKDDIHAVFKMVVPSKEEVDFVDERRRKNIEQAGKDFNVIPALELEPRVPNADGGFEAFHDEWIVATGLIDADLAEGQQLVAGLQINGRCTLSLPEPGASNLGGIVFEAEVQVARGRS